MPTEQDIAALRKLHDRLVVRYRRTGDERLPGVIMYLAASLSGLRLLVERDGGDDA